MSLADDLASINRAQPHRCQLAQWLATLDDDLRVKVQAAVMDSDKPKRKVAAAISRAGHSISETTIGSHRDGECRTCEWSWPSPTT